MSMMYNYNNYISLQKKEEAERARRERQKMLKERRNELQSEM